MLCVLYCTIFSFLLINILDFDVPVRFGLGLAWHQFKIASSRRDCNTVCSHTAGIGKFNREFDQSSGSGGI